MTVRRNNRGKWIVDIDFVHPDGTTERIRKTAPVQNKPAALKYEREVRDSLLDGTYGKRVIEKNEVPTLGAYYETYVASYEANRNTPTGTINVMGLFSGHLLDIFGKKPMNAFGLNEEDRLKTYFKAHSASRYNQAVAVMNGAIELFHTRNRLPGEPFAFSRLEVIDATKPFHSFEAYAALRQAARELGIIQELVVVLGRDAGLRRGEMWGLRPSACHPKHIMVERSETISGKKRFMGPPKGKRVRKIGSTPDVQDVLKRYFREHGKRERMIVRDDGRPFDQGSFQRFIAEIEKRAGLEPTGGAHILRHTFCSHLAILGVPVKVIQELAGHAQLQTTLAYMHLGPNDHQLATAALARPILEVAAT